MKIKLSLHRNREEEIKEKDYDDKAFQTYIFISDSEYVRVSTSYRPSSCDYVPSWYYETYVFQGSRIDKQKDEEWIADETGRDHLELVRSIAENGKYLPLGEGAK